MGRTNGCTRAGVGWLAGSLKMDTAYLYRLPVSEKLKVVTKLWDDIAASGEEIIVPPEVVAEAQRRSIEVKADPSITIDDEELWRRVDE